MVRRVSEPSNRSRFSGGAAAPLWLIAVLLAFLVGWTVGGSPGSAALAQSGSQAGARGIYAFTGQIDLNRFGLFMLDVDQGTLWCYEMESAGNTRKLRLIAARSWIYDRYLQDFNGAGLNWQQVQELVAQQRRQAVSGAAPGGAPAPDTPAAGGRP